MFKKRIKMPSESEFLSSFLGWDNPCFGLIIFDHFLKNLCMWRVAIESILM